MLLHVGTPECHKMPACAALPASGELDSLTAVALGILARRSPPGEAEEGTANQEKQGRGTRAPLDPLPPVVHQVPHWSRRYNTANSTVTSVTRLSAAGRLDLANTVISLSLNPRPGSSKCKPLPSILKYGRAQSA